MNNEQTPPAVPPTNAPPQPKSVTLESHPHQNLLLPLAALVLVVVSVLVIYAMRKPAGSEFTKENVSVAKSDLTSDDQLARLPAGFPTNTPVETANLTDSLSMHYEDMPATLHTLTYTSDDTNTRAYARWLGYMEGEGYTIPETGRNMEQWTLYGTKDNQELTVVISSRERGTQVQVSYLTR